MLICDLHVHTNFSKDGESSVEDILKKAENVGLDVIAITDHDTIDGAKKALILLHICSCNSRYRSLNKTGSPDCFGQ